MKVDFDSDKTTVLINPRMPRRDFFCQKLHEIGLKGHVWVATSGTTSIKWVALSKEALISSAKSVNDHLESTNQDLWIHALPDFHVGGVGIWARSYASGAEVRDFKREEKWDPKRFRDFAASSQGTLTALVPTQLYDLVCSRLEAPKTLRAVLIGGGKLEDSLYSKALHLGWKCLPTYGMTETASQVATAKPERKGDLEILPHVEVEIVKGGFISIKSESLLTCFAEIGSTTTVADPKKNGWLVTEDIGSLHGNVLKVAGRKSDFIKISGESVSLHFLENIFERLKLEYGITDDMSLVALPDERLGSAIHLATTHESLRLLALVEEFQNKVHPFERIRKIHRVEKIPRTPLNKVFRSELQRALL